MYCYFYGSFCYAVLPYNDCKKVTWFEEDTESNTVQVQQALTVGAESITVGHQLGKYKDFFGVLTVTMTQKPSNTTPLFEKASNDESDLLTHAGTTSLPPPKMCVFYIGAIGPGEPVLYSHGFHNASCILDSPDIGPYLLISK